MTIEAVTLREYETVAAVPLTSGQRDGLAGSGAQLAVRPSFGLDNHYDISAGSRVGAVELPGLSVQILPKMPVDRAMFLISYSQGNVAVSPDTSAFDVHDGVFEAIVAGFAAHLRRAFRPGLLQGYRSEEEALPTVRGRIRFEAQIRDRFGLMPPVEVRYDDFTEDIDENRILKAALLQLSRMRVRSDRTRADLRSLLGVLARVSAIEYGRQIPSFSFTRLNNRYESAIRLAELILRSTSFDLGHGGVGSSAFLVDMNDVFENFVVESLRDELRLDSRRFPQGAAGRRLRLDEASRVTLKPDISWWDGQRCAFVGDVKYKKTYDYRVPNADLYQLLAYTTATDLPGGLLIYAKGEEEPGVHVVRHAGKELHIVALDLAGPPSTVLAGIAAVANLIRSMRSSGAVARAS